MTVPDDLIQILSLCPPPALYRDGTIESASMFESLYCYSILYAAAGIKKPVSFCDEIKDTILKYQHSSGGFGREKGTLIETWHAVTICSTLGIEIDKNRIFSFLTECVDLQSGFVNVPSSRPGFLEHLDAGIALASLLNKPVPNQVLSIYFVNNCRKENRGYTRSSNGGNATLEYTWFAIRSLARIILHIRSGYPISFHVLIPVGSILQFLGSLNGERAHF